MPFFATISAFIVSNLSFIMVGDLSLLTTCVVLNCTTTPNYHPPTREEMLISIIEDLSLSPIVRENAKLELEKLFINKKIMSDVISN